MAQAIPNYNTIHQTGPKQIGGGMVVFPKVEARYQGGATLDLSQNNPLTGKKYAAGDFIPAGSMVVFDQLTHKATLVKNDAEDLTGVNGLLEHDILIPEGCIAATCTVVRAGEVYCDRVVHPTATGLPAEAAAKLPLIHFIPES